MHKQTVRSKNGLFRRVRMHFDLFERYHLYMSNFEICVFGSMYICLISMYMYLFRCINMKLQCICTRFDIHACGKMFILCNFEWYECGFNIYIFIRFNVYMLNFVVCVYGLIILSVTERHNKVVEKLRSEWQWEGGAKPDGLVILRNQNQTLLSI